MKIHVRDIISKLSYNELVQNRVIPDVKSLLEPQVLATKRYPPFVYEAKDFSFFGMYMDFVIRAALRIKLQQPIDLGTEPVEHANVNLYQTTHNMNDVASLSLQLVSAMYNTTPYTKAQVNSYVPTTVNITKELVAQWTNLQYYLQGTIRYNTVFTYDNVMGHPDVVTDNCVLDIKTTAAFGKMSSEACLQVLAYYALMKHNNVDIHYVGFILPMQRLLTVYDLSNWNCEAYLQRLNNIATKIIGDTLIPLQQQQQQPNLCLPYNNDIVSNIRNFVVKHTNYPLQLSLCDPITAAYSPDIVEQVPLVRKLITECNLSCYVQACSAINLCANDCINGDYWQQRYLNEDLIYANQMGCKGVIVCTGSKSNKLNKLEDSLSIMEHMIRSALTYATESCPLIIQNGETCTTIEELGNFMFRFTDKERCRLALCVDICRIYAQQYTRPLEYLQHWQRYGPTSIKVVYFNNLSIEHAKIQEIILWCKQQNIHVITK